jgi:hypothetical protein
MQTDNNPNTHIKYYNMKKVHFFDCFKIENALQEGIDDFARQSGYNVPFADKQPKTTRRKTRIIGGGFLLFVTMLIGKLVG